MQIQKLTSPSSSPSQVVIPQGTRETASEEAYKLLSRLVPSDAKHAQTSALSGVQEDAIRGLGQMARGADGDAAIEVLLNAAALTTSSRGMAKRAASELMAAYADPLTLPQARNSIRQQALALFEHAEGDSAGEKDRSAEHIETKSGSAQRPAPVILSTGILCLARDGAREGKANAVGDRIQAELARMVSVDAAAGASGSSSPDDSRALTPQELQPAFAGLSGLPVATPILSVSQQLTSGDHAALGGVLAPLATQVLKDGKPRAMLIHATGSSPDRWMALLAGRSESHPGKLDLLSLGSVQINLDPFQGNLRTRVREGLADRLVHFEVAGFERPMGAADDGGLFLALMLRRLDEMTDAALKPERMTGHLKLNLDELVYRWGQLDRSAQLDALSGLRTALHAAALDRAADPLASIKEPAAQSAVPKPAPSDASSNLPWWA